MQSHADTVRHCSGIVVCVASCFSLPVERCPFARCVVLVDVGTACAWIPVLVLWLNFSFPSSFSSSHLSSPSLDSLTRSGCPFHSFFSSFLDSPFPLSFSPSSSAPPPPLLFLKMAGGRRRSCVRVWPHSSGSGPTQICCASATTNCCETLLCWKRCLRFCPFSSLAFLFVPC